MLLKESPQDFIVIENPLQKELLDHGPYAFCKLEKINRNTKDACNEIARQLHINQKDIRYSGLKDKHAVTTQYVTIKSNKESISSVHVDNCTLTFLGFVKQHLAMGEHESNTFTITVRNCNRQLATIPGFVNYFGEQRFSTDNWIVGRHLIKKEFKEAVQILKRMQGKEFEKLKARWDDQPTDHIGALRLLQRPTLMLYLHAYQSFLWNNIASWYLQEHQIEHKALDFVSGQLALATHIPVKHIPMPGFMTKVPSDIKEAVDHIMDAEDISFKDFVVRSFPECSCTGELRPSIVSLTDLSIKQTENQTYRVHFTLPKGSFATIALATMYHYGQ